MKGDYPLDPLNDDEKKFLQLKYDSLGIGKKRANKRLLLLSSAILI